MEPEQLQRLLLPEGKQDKMIISNENAPLGAKALSPLDFSQIGQPCCFIPKDNMGHL